MKVIRNIPNNPLVVHTGQFTGRSPKDRYFVEQEKTHDKIQWGNTNKQISFHHYQLLFKEIKKQLNKEFDKFINLFDIIKWNVACEVQRYEDLIPFIIKCLSDKIFINKKILTII